MTLTKHFQIITLDVKKKLSIYWQINQKKNLPPSPPPPPQELPIPFWGNLDIFWDYTFQYQNLNCMKHQTELINYNVTIRL